jgi:hypothetical protein
MNVGRPRWLWVFAGIAALGFAFPFGTLIFNSIKDAPVRDVLLFFGPLVAGGVSMAMVYYLTKASIADSASAPDQQRPTGTRPVPISAQGRQHNRSTSEWDVFISHASEDKDAIARPLADALQVRGLRVWYADFSLKVGDSLRKSIDHGLAHSKFGVVILSNHFFAKHWPTQELNGLATREVNGKKVILPVWHGVTFEDVRQYSPTLADRVPSQLRKVWGMLWSSFWRL